MTTRTTRKASPGAVWALFMSVRKWLVPVPTLYQRVSVIAVMVKRLLNGPGKDLNHTGEPHKISHHALRLMIRRHERR